MLEIAIRKYQPNLMIDKIIKLLTCDREIDERIQQLKATVKIGSN